MTCEALAAKISQLQPELPEVEVARLCLLILQQSGDAQRLDDDQHLLANWKSVSFQLDVATDQHAAMTRELSEYCDSGPIQFHPDQIWLLLRTVQVQARMLELYTGLPAVV